MMVYLYRDEGSAFNPKAGRQPANTNTENKMRTFRLTQTGLQEITHEQNEIMIFVSGAPISGSMVTLPKTAGGGQKMNFYRGNAAGSKPFQFKSVELALDAFKQVRWDRQGRKEKAKVFTGNLWIGNIIDDEFIPQKPISQLL